MSAPTPVSSLQGRIKMADGNEIPQLGLGVYEMSSRETYKAVQAALRAGYKHVDTAEWYYNEADVGRAVREYLAETNTPRADLFITSKLMRNRSFDLTLSDLRASLKRAGMDYFDLYLMHSPMGGPTKRKEVWSALLQAKKEGLVKSIGVSNYGVSHINEMVQSGVELPVVNQVDLHPFMTREDIVALCREHNILLEAWAPLVRGLRFEHPAIMKLAKKYKREPAQILLRWGLQHGYVVIPKSANPKRIQSNSQVFDFTLETDEVAELDGLDEYLVTDWDVTTCA